MRNQQGFTLIEVMLSVAIVGIIALASSMLFAQMLEARVRHQVITEVNEQGLAAMTMMTQAIRNAEAITAPAAGTSSLSATIDVVTAGDDPTLFALSSGALTVTEGASSAIALTSSRVTASDLVFTNLSSADSPGSLRVAFTLTYVNPSNTTLYTFAKTFYGTASLRQP